MPGSSASDAHRIRTANGDPAQANIPLSPSTPAEPPLAAALALRRRTLLAAPDGFGARGGALLVGNFGDGRIRAFDPTDGKPVGAIADRGGNVIAIGGLWDLSFGSGTDRLDANALFFAAGPNGESDGVFGRIDVG